MESEYEEPGSSDTSTHQTQPDIDSSRSPKDGTQAAGVVIDQKPKSEGKAADTGKSATQAQKETLDAIKKGERIGLIIAGIVAFGTLGQWITNSCNNAATSAQTEKLIKSANINACAAQKIAAASDRNATAAESFATNAGLINAGIAQAVTQLQAQATKMEAARQTSDTDARNSLKAAIDNSILEQRPWVGLTQFHEAPVPAPKNIVSANGHPMQGNAVVIPTVNNTGRTPARAVVVVYETWEIDGDFVAAVSNSTWMKNLIEDSIAGKFEGVRTIVNGNRQPPRSQDSLDDQSYFPANTRKDADIKPPKRQCMGVLPPDGAIPLNVEQVTSFTNAPDAHVAYITFGKITYTDVWNKPRETIFCSFTPNRFRADLRSCPVYNDMQ
jgi:hypothetical protein